MPDNVESMFYVGEMPWHKIGKQLYEPPDTKTAIVAAGLDWDVSKVNLFSEHGKRVKDYFGIARDDSGEVLGIVGKGYVPLQNIEAFTFFDPLVSNKALEFETAGALGNGEIVWILAKLKRNGEFRVHKDDTVQKYLLLSNSHDGKSAINVKFTPIRVVCQNTLNIALSEGETTRVKHITGLHRRLENVQETVENILAVYKSIEDNFTKMAQYKMSSEKLYDYFNEIYPIIKLNEVKTKSQWKKLETNMNIHAQLTGNFEEGYGVKEFKINGTLWAAYNAVTQFIDHPNNYKLGDNKLLKRIWFGDGDAIKKKAYLFALEYLKVG